jgi:hypothetical protein
MPLQPGDEECQGHVDNTNQLELEAKPEERSGEDFAQVPPRTRQHHQHAKGCDDRGQSRDLLHARTAQFYEAGRGNEHGGSQPGGELAVQPSDQQEERRQQDQAETYTEQARAENARRDVPDYLDEDGSQERRLVIPGVAVESEAMSAQGDFGEFEVLIGSDLHRRAEGQQQFETERGRE